MAQEKEAALERDKGRGREREKKLSVGDRGQGTGAETGSLRRLRDPSRRRLSIEAAVAAAQGLGMEMVGNPLIPAPAARSSNPALTGMQGGHPVPGRMPPKLQQASARMRSKAAGDPLHGMAGSEAGTDGASLDPGNSHGEFQQSNPLLLMARTAAGAGESSHGGAGTGDDVSSRRPFQSGVSAQGTMDTHRFAETPGGGRTPASYDGSAAYDGLAIERADGRDYGGEQSAPASSSSSSSQRVSGGRFVGVGGDSNSGAVERSMTLPNGRGQGTQITQGTDGFYRASGAGHHIVGDHVGG